MAKSFDSLKFVLPWGLHVRYHYNLKMFSPFFLKKFYVSRENFFTISLHGKKIPFFVNFRSDGNFSYCRNAGCHDFFLFCAIFENIKVNMAISFIEWQKSMAILSYKRPVFISRRKTGLFTSHTRALFFVFLFTRKKACRA